MQVLRDTLNCTLPIEIIYNGPREMDDWAVNKFQVLCSLRAHSRYPLEGSSITALPHLSPTGTVKPQSLAYKLTR